jgi:hypothetical protein
MSWSGYAEGMDLESLIEGGIEAFAEDREKFWTADPQDVYLRLVDEIGEKILGATKQFSAPLEKAEDEYFTWDAALALTEVEEVAQLMLERLQIDVAREYSTGTHTKADRCFDLTKFVLRTQPSEHVLRFLRRLARCYIAGFDSEAVVMCRAVLENSVRSAVAQRGIATQGVKTRIRKLQEEGVLTPAEASGALVVWERGNKAVHDDPETAKGVLETIELTLATVAALAR